MLLTIGHGLMSTEQLVSNLHKHGVKLVVDVRSTPGSTRAPQFNRRALSSALERAGIDYMWCGALGGRPAPHLHTRSGAPDYERMIAEPETRLALDDVGSMAASRRTALLCSESRPEECHRSRMLEPAFEMMGLRVDHILPDGGVETQPTLFG